MIVECCCRGLCGRKRENWIGALTSPFSTQFYSSHFGFLYCSSNFTTEDKPLNYSLHNGYEVMLPTPSTSHVDFDRTYEPAEDSFLFLDTLSSATETQFLTQRFGTNQSSKRKDASTTAPLVVEVGTGSGVVLAFIVAQAKAIFGTEDILAIGTDVNPFACQATEQTVSQACQRNTARAGSGDAPRATSLLAALKADLTSPLRSGVVDVLIFNPPYVPSPELPGLTEKGYDTISNAAGDRVEAFEEDSHLLSLSYAGGLNGMEVTNRLLEQLPCALNSERGVAYILLCQQNEPEEVLQRVRGWGSSWSVTVVGRSGKQAGWEKLQIVRISRC